MNWKSTFNTRGFMLVSLLIILPCLLVVLLGVFSLAQRAQDRIALLYRLEVCALDVIQSRKRLLQSLARSNRAMAPLRQVVYVARNSRFVPAITLPAGITARVAMTLLHKLRQGQELRVLAATAREAGKLRCKAGRFSRRFAYCRFPVARRQYFYRKPALYPDIPGDLLPRRHRPLLKVSCHSHFGSQVLGRTLQLRAAAPGQLRGLRHSYGK